MVRLQIQVTESQYSRIRKEAFKQKVPISKFIRSLIDMSFSVPHSSKSAKRAFSFVGMGRDSQSDVSEKHDQYLAGFSG
ncbi:MAG: hypothetical protein M1169_10145 [Firmicutes bacterium]|nr:hypothetical protein [Bacillota bacterium]